TSQATTPGQTFTAGTVGLNSAATGTCATDINSMEPGDIGSCTVTVNYGGSLPSYLGAEASATGTLAPQLTFTIDGVTQTSSTPVVFGNTVNDGDATYTATVDYTLSSGAGNGYQTTSAEVYVTFFAVQCSNNLAGDPGAANENCGDAGPASWSQTPASAISFAVADGGTAGWTANDTAITLSIPVVTVSPANSGAYAIVEFNNVGTTLPTDAPSFNASVYSTGTPRWYIQLGPAGTGPYLFGYPDGTWNVNECAGVNGGTTYTYADAVAAIASNCNADLNDVTSVNIVADTSITTGYTTVLTDIQYNDDVYTS
ncbi:MAG: hypothetical protein WB020_10120, partial [Candidatus Dormiibacterota bacterium]